MGLCTASSRRAQSRKRLLSATRPTSSRWMTSSAVATKTWLTRHRLRRPRRKKKVLAWRQQQKFKKPYLQKPEVVQGGVLRDLRRRQSQTQRAQQVQKRRGGAEGVLLGTQGLVSERVSE